jgi:acyl carrier protein
MEHYRRMERSMTVDETIRQVLAEHARLAVPVESLADDTDLFGAGMTSHASVNVMLALEDAFDFEFSENLLKKSTFESVAAIRAGVLETTGG